MTAAPAGGGEDWRAISRRMRSEPAVFVAGVARSGTSALRATLERHPSFRPRKDQSPETHLFARPDLVREVTAGRRRQRLFEFLLEDEAAAARVDALAAGVPELGHEDLARLFFAVAKEVRGVRRLIEKTPRHVLHLPLIDRSFPECRFLLCVRHPLDVYSSYRKRLADDVEPGAASGSPTAVPAGKEWLTASPEEFARDWAEKVAIVADWCERYPDRSLLVRYEDLTVSPRAEVERICRFLGEPFAERELFGGEDGDASPTGAPDPSARITVNTKRWDSWLDETAGRVIESATADAMERVGYRRYLA